jgi:lipid-A-disaccharide synthase
MKYYFIAGEASGDLHASNLMKELKKEDIAADFRFWGGDLMQKQGGELVKHYRDLAFMGFAEVIANLSTILKNLSFCKKDILKFEPDVLILVDYPGFNLKIAKFARQHGIRVFYYISPQVWAWKKSRVKAIRRDIDRMFVILPFEKDFYKSYNVEVDFVGHPLLDAIRDETEKLNSPEDFRVKNKLDQRPVIALLPGSRKQEISKMLRVMLSMVPEFKDYQFVVAGAPSVPEEFYREVLAGTSANIVFGATHDLLQNAYAALVTSGTATLETALMNVPEVVCYKGSYFSYQIAKRIVDIKYISLVNLIMDARIVTELIQNDFNPKRLKTELSKILDEKNRIPLFNDYKLLKSRLGGSGASAKAAKLMTGYLS